MREIDTSWVESFAGQIGFQKHFGIICDPLSQNEHKVTTGAIKNSQRFKFFTMQALK